MGKERKRKLYLEGQVIGNYKVVKFLGFKSEKSTKTLYLCIDIFGQEQIIDSGTLRSKAFGKNLINKQSSKWNRQINKCYHAMLERCYCSNTSSYKYYGARGIRVEDTWLGKNGFYAYRDWCVSKGWTPGITVDRINNDGNYGPDNCQLLTRSKNSQKRRNVFLNEELASDIRKEHSISNQKTVAFCKKTSKKYNVSVSTIYEIIRNKSWVVQ